MAERGLTFIQRVSQMTRPSKPGKSYRHGVRLYLAIPIEQQRFVQHGATFEVTLHLLGTTVPPRTNGVAVE